MGLAVADGPTLGPPQPAIPRFTPEAMATDTFPINTTTGPREGSRLASTGGQRWWYIFGCDSTNVETTGTEYYFAGPRPAEVSEFARWPPETSDEASRFLNFAVAHPMKVSHDFTAGHNAISIEIDRSASSPQGESAIERYVGGFAYHTCSDSQGMPGQSFIVLESVTTGRQFEIRAGSCDRGCGSCSATSKSALYIELDDETSVCSGNMSFASDSGNFTLTFCSIADIPDVESSTGLFISLPETWGGTPATGLASGLVFRAAGERMETPANGCLATLDVVRRPGDATSYWELSGHGTCQAPARSPSGREVRIRSFRFDVERHGGTRGVECTRGP
jgi:hypothetical protein